MLEQPTHKAVPADVESALGEAEGSPAPPTVLVIDDDIRILAACRELLQSAGYNVMVAQDGKVGTELYRIHYEAISVVVLDWILPSMTGDKWVDYIIEINPDVGIVFVTGRQIDDATYAELEPKVSGFLYKPFNAQQLIGSVEKALPQSLVERRTKQAVEGEAAEAG